MLPLLPTPSGNWVKWKSTSLEGGLRTFWGLSSSLHPRNRDILWAGRLTQSLGAQDLCEPGLIILAAVFRPLGLGFQKHFKSGRFSSPPDLKKGPPGVLVCCTKLGHHNYLSDKVMSH